MPAVEMEPSHEQIEPVQDVRHQSITPPRRKRAILPISRRAVAISVSRSLRARCSSASRIELFVCSRTQMTNGNPKRARYAAFSVSNRAISVRREPIETRRGLFAGRRRASAALRARPPAKSGCAAISATRRSSGLSATIAFMHAVSASRSAERPPLRRELRDPRRALESEADCRDERSPLGRIEIGDRHRTFRIRPIFAMTTLLLRNARLLATFDDADRTFEDGGIFVRDGVIEYVGPSDGLPPNADVTIDASGMVVLPGLVNTHHHFFQTLTRNLPIAQDAPLFPWLVAHYPIWARITPDGVRSATAIAIAELMLSGCTTAADHGYIWKNGARVDDQIDVARQMGLRFHASRGSMSIGQSKGGLPPDDLVEDEAAILQDCVRVIDAYHDPARFAMTRIVIAPCSPFSVSTELMRESAAAGARAWLDAAHASVRNARRRNVLSRTLWETARCARRQPGLDWARRLVRARNRDERRGNRILRPVANRCRALSELEHAAWFRHRADSCAAPEPVCGSASASTARPPTMRRICSMRHGRRCFCNASCTAPARFRARDALRFATRGGAAVLGRDDIGYLAPNMAADFIGVRLDSLHFAGGAVHDPLAALVFCRTPNVDLSVIAGTIRVRDGSLAWCRPRYARRASQRARSCPRLKEPHDRHRFARPSRAHGARSSTQPASFIATCSG